jgi:hypothetical protein
MPRQQSELSSPCSLARLWLRPLVPSLLAWFCQHPLHLNCQRSCGVRHSTSFLYLSSISGSWISERAFLSQIHVWALRLWYTSKVHAYPRVICLNLPYIPWDVIHPPLTHTTSSWLRWMCHSLAILIAQVPSFPPFPLSIPPVHVPTLV